MALRIVHISDTHNRHKQINLPDGDILVHSGDATGRGREAEWASFFKWLIQVVAPKYKHVIFVGGNHDVTLDPKFGEYDMLTDDVRKIRPRWLQQMLRELPANVHYLENESIELEGLKFWGSPITPWFNGDHWAYNKHRGDDIRKVWREIPVDTDVIITHGPVAYQLDWVPKNQYYAGCEDLREIVKAYCPLLHLSGHIHESRGISSDAFTTYSNACMVDFSYIVVHEPNVFDIEDREVSIVT